MSGPQAKSTSRARGGCLGIAAAVVIVIAVAAAGHSSSSSVQQSGATIPASCGALSEDYASLGHIAGSFSALAESFFKLIPEAAKAGETQNAEATSQITTKLDEGTAKISQQTTEVETLNSKETSDAEGCK